MIDRTSGFRQAFLGFVPICSLALSTGSAAADTWTNAAGHSFEAAAVAIDGRIAVFQRPAGEEFQIPLFSLSANDQKRVREALYGPAIPPALQSAYSYAEAQLDRARLLSEDGQDEPYASRRDRIIRSFQKACEQLSYDGNNPEVRLLVARLKAR